jgi:thioredoxin reductase/Pyruvate/2-oxoacid:ferredoxin oxidoreductase delta subunit
MTVMLSENLIFVYLLPFGLALLVRTLVRHRKSRHASNIRFEATEAGLTEPPSLHPVIDPAHCLGCAACVKACPEGNILGIISGKAVLIEPTHCIGHGACARSCPTHAITLVFGTETRGVDIPFVGADFQTNVEGIYIAGELGGMGLIRNAVEQGKQAVDEIRKTLSTASVEFIDIMIIGAGPAGFAATLAAKEYGLKSVTVEQEALGGTVAHYPRGKLVMTQPVQLPIIGKTKLKDPSKEQLLEFWTSVEKQSGIKINYGERVSDVKAVTGGFEVMTTKKTYKAKTVLLAIGRRGTPRKLDVLGEGLSKVVYRMIDPEQYTGKHVLVVGGGDSALEAAAEIADQAGSTVSLSYRSESFSRAKPRNRDRIQALAENQNITLFMKSSVKEIRPDNIILEHDNTLKTIKNDDVIICAGGILPTAFLKNIGIDVETKHGTI